MNNGNKWLERVDNIINEHLHQNNFNNGQLAAAIHISERHLFRKVKAVTGLPPHKYVRQYRLRQAKHYLETGTYKTVKDTSAAVGYINISYFISQFEKEYGRKPLAVLQEAGWR
jgi:AraC-like DNA-binding protein